MATSSTRIITLDALVQDDPPTIALGGLRFDGSQVSWPIAARFEGTTPRAQLAILAALLRDRCTTGPDGVTDAWLDQHLQMGVVANLTAVLFRGEDPTASAPTARGSRGKGKA